MEAGKEKIKYLFKSVIIVMLMTIVLIVLAAALMQYAGIGSDGIAAAVIVMDIVPLFAGAFYLGRRVQEKKFVWGILLGCVIVLAYAGIKMLVYRENVLDGGGIRTIVLMILSGMAGGMFS